MTVSSECQALGQSPQPEVQTRTTASDWRAPGAGLSSRRRDFMVCSHHLPAIPPHIWFGQNRGRRRQRFTLMCGREECFQQQFCCSCEPVSSMTPGKRLHVTSNPFMTTLRTWPIRGCGESLKPTSTCPLQTVAPAQPILRVLP